MSQCLYGVRLRSRRDAPTGEAQATADMIIKAAPSSVAVNGPQYGFAYDDVNGQSPDFSSGDAQYVQVAIGSYQTAKWSSRCASASRRPGVRACPRCLPVLSSARQG
jgi:hypothetical protein